jgi:hypothetical protein
VLKSEKEKIEEEALEKQRLEEEALEKERLAQEQEVLKSEYVQVEEETEILKSNYVPAEEALKEEEQTKDVVIEDEKAPETEDEKFQRILDNGLSFKDKGNKEFAAKNFPTAIQLYKDALSYVHPEVFRQAPADKLKEMIRISNVCLNNLRCFFKAVCAITTSPISSSLSSLRRTCS